MKCDSFCALMDFCRIDLQAETKRKAVYKQQTAEAALNQTHVESQSSYILNTKICYVYCCCAVQNGALWHQKSTFKFTPIFLWAIFKSGFKMCTDNHDCYITTGTDVVWHDKIKTLIIRDSWFFLMRDEQKLLKLLSVNKPKVIILFWLKDWNTQLWNALF